MTHSERLALIVELDHKLLEALTAYMRAVKEIQPDDKKERLFYEIQRIKKQIQDLKQS